jgi:putative heme-binding domain-containing protein
MKSLTLMFHVCVLVLTLAMSSLRSVATDTTPLKNENLVAWCIVPFDASRRTPAERAEMLIELGLRRCAYDWREEHVPTFEEEIRQYQQHGIEFFAFWGVHDLAFELFKKYELHPQIWHMLGDPGDGDQTQKVTRTVASLMPLVERTAAMKCQLGLYNHGGWGGEPGNMVAVCQKLHNLGHTHVGIVYNFHHGHDHIDDWSTSFELMQPYLICLNLNGMNDGANPKILPIGQGTHEADMIRSVLDAGYQGPVGIIDHREQLDARESLQENLEGLKRLREQLEAQPSNDDSAFDIRTFDRKALEPGAPDMERFPLMSGEPEFSAELLEELQKLAEQDGDAMRGAVVFTDDRWACMSCHQVGAHGGEIGPNLDAVARGRTPEQMVEGLVWPNRQVETRYMNWHIMTNDGEILTGLKVAEDEHYVQLQNPSTGERQFIQRSEIEAERTTGSVMPTGLMAAMNRQQQLDLLRFLMEIGRGEEESNWRLIDAVTHSMMRGPAEFEFENKPLVADRWKNARHPVARDRLYDFYSKQAEHFRDYHPMPRLLSAFPGLDGGKPGHWGNQNETTWANDRWNLTDLSSIQCGVFHGSNFTVPRGMCVQLGDQPELFACYNPDTLAIEALWQGSFLKFDSHRHGFMGGVRPAGDLLPLPQTAAARHAGDYQGFYRYGKRIVFSYRVDGVDYLDAPWVENGRLVREVAPLEEHSLRAVIDGGPSLWTEVVETSIAAGTQQPYAIDTIELPYENPWKALIFCSGLACLEDGSVLVCTMQGDVWRVTGLEAGSQTARWRRYAAGLHQALGMLETNGQVFVQCRDQLVQLEDRNGDGEADFYRCFNKDFITSPAGHDFICGLQRDAQGNFYTASGNQGLIQISSDGQRVGVVATGFRNPDGLGILPDGSLTVPVSEGEWTPASAIALVPSPGGASEVGKAFFGSLNGPPHYGYRGPQDNLPPALPLVYLPRGLDNSAGGQVYVESQRFGPLHDQLLHFSFGAGSWFLVLRDEVEGVQQGAVIPLAGDFLAGVHRGRFSPADGQLYVCGMAGWGTYTPDDGCLQRVRYTGSPVQLPVQFRAHENGIWLRFSQPIDAAVAENLEHSFAQCWNYRYSAAYGSPEFSTRHPGVVGHDPLMITKAHVLEDRQSLFLQIPDIQPVNQLHLRLYVNEDENYSCSPVASGHDLFFTIHQLEKPFVDFEGYRPMSKYIAAHPLLSDMLLNATRRPNPWRETIAKARRITVEAGRNLTYTTPRIEAAAGEPLALQMKNPDVVPHNWVLVDRGTLNAVGELANALIAAPEAMAMHYVPESEHVIVYTDVVAPGEEQTIFFHAPTEPGKYPFLCTFPGHWMVMNGVLIVE